MSHEAPPSLHRSPIGELLALALPTVAQMASYTLMQFVDTWMLSRVSTTVDAPTAAGNSGLFTFSLISFGMGVLWVVNTLASQSFGRRSFEECGRFLWQGVWFSIGFSVLLLPLNKLMPPAFARLGHEPLLVAMETTYLRIVLSASVLKLVGTSFAQFLLAIDHPVMVFISTAIGLSVNALASFALVLGHFGFHSQGIAGTAWAQNIGVGVETACLIFFAFTPRIRQAFGVTQMRLRLAELKTLLIVGIPSGVQILADVLAWSLFCMWVMGRFGTDVMAANNFMMQYMKVSFMPAFGISIAVTALVGRYIGMQRPDLAAARANLGFRLTSAYMLLCGLLLFLLRRPAIAVFTSDPNVLRIGSMLMIFAAVYQFFDAMYISYNGALRGAGDTFVPALTTGLLCWTITVLGGYATARFFAGFGPAGPWSVATFYGILLGLFMLFRFRAGGWKRIHLMDAPPSNSAADSDRLIAVHES